THLNRSIIASSSLDGPNLSCPGAKACKEPAICRNNQPITATNTDGCLFKCLVSKHLEEMFSAGFSAPTIDDHSAYKSISG
ncbi:MAG: hypothetical protein KAR47_18030, partial [Planctomycetes bacterium]|nr:hypothetical protein [Planctomycetota bacterium]